jgi:hypothetical protein
MILRHKSRRFQRPSVIGAPRFELGTSSPPDSSSRVAAFGPEWPEVAQEQGFRVQNLALGHSAPRAEFAAFGHGLGTA